MVHDHRGDVTVRAAIYARCSTSEQDFTRQLEELRADAKRNGWDVVAELGSYISGGSNESDLSRLQSAAHRGEFDCLMVWELSRLSRRGPGAILNFVSQFERNGAKVWSRTEQWLNVEGPQREILIAVFGWVAKWERDMISARTKSALAQRKALGVKLGRPKGSKDKKPRTRALKRGGLVTMTNQYELNNRPFVEPSTGTLGGT